MAKTRSRKRISRRKSMRGGVDQEYLEGLKTKTDGELEAELDAVTAERDTAKNDGASKSVLDELDEKHIAVTKALTATLNKAVPDGPRAPPTRQELDDFKAGLARDATARAAPAASAKLPGKSRVADLPGLPKPYAGGRVRRRSRKTRRQSRRIR